MNCLRNLFYFRIFRQNGVKSCYKYENTKNRHIWTSMTPKLRSVHPTGESGNKNFCAVKLCGMHQTAESNCTPRIQNRNLCESLVAFKGTIRRNPVRGHLSWKKTFEEKFFDLLSLKFWLSGVMHTAESNFLNFVIEYLGKMGIELENTSACWSGAQVGSNHGKK